MAKLITQKAQVVIANTAVISGWFEMPNWATFCMALFPDITNGVVGLEFTIDGGTTNAPVLKADGSGDAVLIDTGFDPGWQDISDYIRALPDNETHNTMARFTCTVAQVGAKTISIYFRE